MKITAKEIAQMRLAGKKPDETICLVLDFDYANDSCLVINLPDAVRCNFLWANSLDVVVVVNSETRPARLIEVVSSLIYEARTVNVLNADTGCGKTVKDEYGVYVYNWSFHDERVWEEHNATAAH